MAEDAICPPINVPAAIASIRSRLDALDQAEASTQGLLSSVPADIAYITARLDAMDRATTLLHQDYTQVPTELDRRAIQIEQVFDAKLSAVTQSHVTLQKFADTRDVAIDRATADLRAHFLERLMAIDLRFAERDLRFNQASQDHQKAIDAALSAVNLASEKNERAFTKQIDGLSETARTTTESMGKRIDDLKERLILREGTCTGTQQGVSAVTGWVVAGVMTVTAIVSTMIALYNVVHAHT